MSYIPFNPQEAQKKHGLKTAIRLIGIALIAYDVLAFLLTFNLLKFVIGFDFPAFMSKSNIGGVPFWNPLSYLTQSVTILDKIVNCFLAIFWEFGIGLIGVDMVKR